MPTGVAGASDRCHILVAWGLMRQPWDPEAFQGWIASDLGISFTLVTKELGDIRYKGNPLLLWDSVSHL